MNTLLRFFPFPLGILGIILAACGTASPSPTLPVETGQAAISPDAPYPGPPPTNTPLQGYPAPENGPNPYPPPSQTTPLPTAAGPAVESPAATELPPPPTETPPPTQGLPPSTVEVTGDFGFALRFFGTGSGGIDRVKIQVDPPTPADIGATDFTIEFWMKALLEENNSPECGTGNDNWITGNILLDRDIWGMGDYGDFGISMAGGRLAFGTNNGEWGEGLCSPDLLADGNWHHIAITRRLEDGQMRLYIDGRLASEAAGPPGDLSYRDARETQYPNSDPFLVIGAEKHDAGSEYPSFSGWLDEVRLSSTIRYEGDFTPPSGPYEPDADTAALWHFDEGSGDVIADSASGGGSPGSLQIGGPDQGPQWVESDLGR